MDSKFSLIDEKANPFPFVSICKISGEGGERETRRSKNYVDEAKRTFSSENYISRFIYMYCLRLTSVKRTKIERDSLLEPTVTVAL